MGVNVDISLWYNHGEKNENAFPDAPDLGKSPHAQKVMAHMGITYHTAWARPVADSWTFYGCENVPDGPHPRWMIVWEDDK